MDSGRGSKRSNEQFEDAVGQARRTTVPVAAMRHPWETNSWPRQNSPVSSIVQWVFITRGYMGPQGIPDMLDFMESTKDGAGECHSDDVQAALHFLPSGWGDLCE